MFGISPHAGHTRGNSAKVDPRARDAHRRKTDVKNPSAETDARMLFQRVAEHRPGANSIRVREASRPPVLISTARGLVDMGPGRFWRDLVLSRVKWLTVSCPGALGPEIFGMPNRHRFIS